MENKLNPAEIIDHCVHECHSCNQKLTEIFIHNRQEHCDHRWEKLKKHVEGCKKCWKTRNKK